MGDKPLPEPMVPVYRRIYAAALGGGGGGGGGGIIWYVWFPEEHIFPTICN